MEQPRPNMCRLALALLERPLLSVPVPEPAAVRLRIQAPSLVLLPDCWVGPV
jgi:hypothetical protein